jgi:ABC-type transport system involved in cytochrome bd biosynthesis fused ATPase/permease subunit
MLERRLLRFAEGAAAHIALAVAAQWFGLLAGAVVVITVSHCIGQIMDGAATAASLAAALCICAAAALFRAGCGVLAAKESFRVSSGVKKRFREKIYEKLLQFGGVYTETLSTAEALQVAVEGVDQLEVYFGKYLPRFFYSLLAPVTLFVLLAPLDWRAALVLLACAPLIPLLLLAIARMAGKMTRRQWRSYISLGDVFLENLQGMTTLKAYAADAARQEIMAKAAEAFRRSTMRILRMQLASLVVMDVVAFGGAAVGVVLAALAFARGSADIAQALIIALLSAEFFIPLRQFGSLFHVSMNGVVAGERMFRFLDLELPADGEKAPPENAAPIKAQELSLTYPGAERPALDGVSFTLDSGLVSLVGVSGSGKSTVAAILSGERVGYDGSVTIADAELRELARARLRDSVTLAPCDGYVFAGTVAENLRLAKADAADDELIAALEQARLWDFLANEQGLATTLAERGGNLSGGQRQRLCLARALLKDSDVYIFDEATSNIDAESEAAIMAAIYALAQKKTILLITHRLANVVPSKRIYLLENGKITESGSHSELMALGGGYAGLFHEQLILENVTKGGAGT